MAKSPNEQVKDLALEMRGLLERDVAREQVLERLLNKLDQLETQSASKTEKLELRVNNLEIENATLKQLVADHIAQYQVWDRRRWGLILLLFGTVLSLASGLIVTLAKKSGGTP